MSRDVEDRGDTQLHRPFGPAVVLTAEELAVLEEAHTRALVALPDRPELSDRPELPDRPERAGPPELAESQGAHPDQAAATRAGASDRSSPGRVRQQAPSSSADVAAGLAQARWSLIARGLLTVDGRLPEDTDVGQFLQILLDVRLAADVLVVVERILGEGRRDVRLLHLVPQGGVVEDLHPEGLYGLDLALSVPDLVTSVTEMVVPGDARAGEGPEATADLTDAAVVSSLPTLLHRPTVLAELTVVRPQQEAMGHLIALGPRGCWAGPTPAGPGLLRLSPVQPGWVGELVTSWVQGVVGVSEGGTMTG